MNKIGGPLETDCLSLGQAQGGEGAQGDVRGVGEDEDAIVGVDAAEGAGVAAIAAAGLLRVGEEVGYFHGNSAVCEARGEHLQLAVELVQLAVAQRELGIGQAGGFRDGGIVARKRREGGELRRARGHGHARMVLRLVVRQADYVVVARHALCPPIWRLRSRCVAPSP